MSETIRHYVPGSVPVTHPRTADTWRIAVQFIDDPAVYSQVITEAHSLADTQAHLPLTVDACGYRMRDLVRVTFTRL